METQATLCHAEDSTAARRWWWKPGAADGSTRFGLLSGLVGGGCCIAAALVVSLGVVGSAAAAGFIQSYMPYFVAASVAMMVGHFAWMLRKSGFRLRTAAGHLLRHGLMMGAVYIVVLGISMAAAAAAGV
jgi:hypothetical protein